MAQQLKDILKQAHNIIKGVHASQTSAGSTGKDPGVDYKPKSGDEDDLIAKHSVQKWDDPQATSHQHSADQTKYSLDTPQNSRMGNNHEKSKKDYFTPVKEAKEAEQTSCNMTKEGVECPVHGKGNCSSMKSIKETWYVQHADGKRTEHISGSEAYKAHKRSPGSRVGATHGAGGQKAHGVLGKHYDKPIKMGPWGAAPVNKKKKANEEVELDEVLTKKTSAGETISDFVHSDNPKFAGKSKEKRKQMALGAYYSKQREQKEEVMKEDLAVPLLGGDGKPRGSADGAEEMIRAELKALANKAMHLAMTMPGDLHVEPWIQAKIAQAKSFVSDVHDHMIYRDKDNEEMADTSGASGGSAGGSLVMNGTMDTPLTFPNMSVDVNTGQNV